jgi:hypothetical protein
MRAHSIAIDGSATVLKGSGIKYRKLDQDQRAELAADVVTGRRPFVPSCEQACAIFGVPTLVLRKHLKARRELAAQHPQTTNGKAGNGHGDGAAAVVAALLAFTPAERIEVSRTLGLDWVWDEMIAPGIQEDRQIGTR